MAQVLKGETGLGPGMKRVSEWVGRKVETVAVMRNGNQEIPAGTVAEVTQARSGLTLKTDPCKCCGVRVYITRVHSSHVRLVG